MTVVTIVEQNGSLSEKSVKDLTEENYYKCCSYRKKDGFDKRTEWNVVIDKKKLKVEVWSRNDGKANTENKYDFPPPIDNDLYFGKCLVVCYEKNKLCDLSNSLWLKIYEHLFGGFEDITKEEEMSDDEEELGEFPIIGSLSFGDLRRFRLRNKQNKKLTHTYDLRNGSLLIMKGATQKLWEHEVPKTKKKVSGRINLTFRYIV